MSLMRNGFSLSFVIFIDLNVFFCCMEHFLQLMDRNLFS